MHSAPSWHRFLPPAPAPRFADAGDIVVERLSTLRPARRIDIPTWAESRHLSTISYQGLWSNSFAPYMIEPSRMATSRKYRAVVFIGPARSSKSESLVLNSIGHRIECAPADTMIVCQTQGSAKEFSEKKLGQMLRANPKLVARQGTGRGADNIYSKKFDGNMNLKISWPVIGSFSQNEYVLVVLTDRDRMPDDVDGEGDPLMLAMKRTQHAGSLGMAIEESSPGRLILVDDDWKAGTPHELPPCSGIYADYNLGTRGAFYWVCPSCGDPFRPEFDRLMWETKATPGESAKTVEMICPRGCCIGPDKKFVCNEAGIWLHETSNGDEVVEIDDSSVRDTDIASYRCEGPIAAMQSWEQLVLRYLQAKSTFDLTGDDTQLKATINLDQGRNYRPQVREVGDSISEDTLRALAERYPLKIVPASARFTTVQVDIQGNRFVVQVDAHGEGLERWLIDRFDLLMPPELAPGGQRDENGNPARALDPARYIEDWDVLPELLERVYPVENSEFGLMPVAMIVDSAGRPGVTRNAYRFLRKMQRKGLGKRVFLAKGSARLDDRARYVEPEKVLQQKGRKLADIKLVFVGTNKVKDEVVLALTRKEAGPGKYHLSEHLPAQVFSEMTAEVRTESGWERRKSGLANEAFDLAVYGAALVIILKGEKIDWANPPHWALPANENSFAVRQVPGSAKSTLVHSAPARGRRVRSQGIR
ncbi:terminase gpA endonuclease subunit [Rhizobium mongolense]|uniref:Phage terminase large subunit GpA-like protein n=1 Tax=Rhizobium mongolense TaxID=57676 RepID=A0A7W6RRZ5_9HYPH|nr:terminase gpA endonuclease subunit [Rhizobium mongolense]MBB4277036.1 phage terminase large subunit GpA-like protein [Rhizobium mongolense]